MWGRPQPPAAPSPGLAGGSRGPPPSLHLPECVGLRKSHRDGETGPPRRLDGDVTSSALIFFKDFFCLLKRNPERRRGHRPGGSGLPVGSAMGDSIRDRLRPGPKTALNRGAARPPHHQLFCLLCPPGPGLRVQRVAPPCPRPPTCDVRLLPVSAPSGLGQGVLAAPGAPWVRPCGHLDRLCTPAPPCPGDGYTRWTRGLESSHAGHGGLGEWWLLGLCLVGIFDFLVPSTLTCCRSFVGKSWLSSHLCVSRFSLGPGLHARLGETLRFCPLSSAPAVGFPLELDQSFHLLTASQSEQSRCPDVDLRTCQGL